MPIGRFSRAQVARATIALTAALIPSSGLAEPPSVLWPEAAPPASPPPPEPKREIPDMDPTLAAEEQRPAPERGKRERARRAQQDQRNEARRAQRTPR